MTAMRRTQCLALSTFLAAVLPVCGQTSLATNSNAALSTRVVAYNLEARVDPELSAVGASYRTISGAKVPDLLLARQIFDTDLLLIGTHGRRWLNHWLSEPVAGEVSPEAEPGVGDASAKTDVRPGP